MKVLLIDDEPPARLELRRLLADHEDATVIGEASTVREALKLTVSSQPDVVFLDVKLVGENGFDYVAQVSDLAPRIVFVTAYDRYAIRGFECNALDYLLKPILPERLGETLRRVRAQVAMPRTCVPGEDDVTFIKTNRRALWLRWSDVHHIASNGNYTLVYLTDGTNLIVHRPLKKWIAMAPEGMFLQVRRTTLVRRDLVQGLSYRDGRKCDLLLHDGGTVSVGREYVGAARAAVYGGGVSK